MKKVTILAILILVFITPTYSQNITNPKIRELIDKAEDCYNQGMDNCEEIYEQAIELGEKTNAPYLDYLHYSLARRKIMSGDGEGAMKIYEEQIDNCKDPMTEIAFMNLK